MMQCVIVILDDDLMVELDCVMVECGYQNCFEVICDLVCVGLKQVWVEVGDMIYCVGVFFYIYDYKV